VDKLDLVEELEEAPAVEAYVDDVDVALAGDRIMKEVDAL
jgi:hypothetical protein